MSVSILNNAQKALPELIKKLKKDAPIVVAIDGVSGSGKGTLSKKIADFFGWPYLDTGLLYRYVGYALMQHGRDADDVVFALKIIDAMEDVSFDDPALRRDDVGNAASKISQFKPIRQALLDLQHNFATNPPGKSLGVVLDGRDIGTVICPNADFKIFVTADVDARAKRRYGQMQEMGHEADLDVLLKQIYERDDRDRNRSVSPTVPAKDALVLDTTHICADTVFVEALAYIQSKLETLLA